MSGNLPELLPLTPIFDAEQHSDYVSILEKALENPLLLNIALTGNYGVGKSSILAQLAKNMPGATVAVSLSTLGGTSAPTLDNPDNSETRSRVQDFKTTNRIQKEIVKQLLYRNHPSKTPGSRYRRLSSFRFFHRLVPTAAAVYAVGILAAILGFKPTILGIAPETPISWLVATALVLAVLAALITLVQRAIPQWRISGVGAAGTSISLTEPTASYFDEYLDEIVYCFEANKSYKVVVFEDIDRFDQPQIFETLRELNTVLNRAEQVSQEVRFIYAVKDSIFEKIGVDNTRESGNTATNEDADAAEAELTRANRTKFFDLVIPVVPFITSRNARDLMTRTLHAADPELSTDLIDLAAKHITDMRLIKNIHNEYVVFSKHIFSPTGIEGLDRNKLLAMLIYKNIHLSDFERIPQGTSVLDRLYQSSREIVEKCLPEQQTREASLTGQLGTDEALHARAQRLGSKLIAYGDLVAEHLFNGTPFTVQIQVSDTTKEKAYYKPRSSGSGT